VQILAVSGSLRNESTNTRLLAAAVRLAPANVEIRLASGVGALPAFSPDLDPSEIEIVAQWVQEMRRADAIIVSTPEYAGGYPGALKNAFDWLVATDAFVQKPFMLLNASARSVNAQRTFTKVLETMSGVHVERATTTIDLLGSRLDVPEILASAAHAARIRNAIQTFVAHLDQTRARNDAGTNPQT
jgi:NAD(P)H-dependent FMN reductase